MTRTLRRWLTLVGVAAALLLPVSAVSAQKGGKDKDDLSVGRAADQGEGGSTPDTGKSPALPYAFAGLAAIGVLLIVCMPSRKG